MLLHLKIIGWVLIALALSHIAFPRHFKWRQALSSLTLLNRQMMQVHTFFIAFVVFAMGLLCLTSATELMGTTLGHKLSLMLAIFWGLRLLVQFFWYSPRLWMGKKLETGIHILFSLLWAYFTVVFFIVSR